jgi:transcriptional regulator with XRE-family HTH domain
VTDKQPTNPLQKTSKEPTNPLQSGDIARSEPQFPEVGAAFRRSRLGLGWSQEFFAEKAIVSVGNVRAAEAGNRITARSHKALVDAINKARAACFPPQAMLTLSYPTEDAPASEPIEPPEESLVPAQLEETREDTYPDQESVPTEPMMAEETKPYEIASLGPVPLPKGDGEPPVLNWTADQGLVQLGDQVWPIKDACEGVIIFGATGSGKTSGSGQAFAHSYLQAGFGGLVLCTKPDEFTLWKQYAAETGRQSDLVLFGTDPKWSFNFLEHESRRQWELRWPFDPWPCSALALPMTASTNT